MKIFKFFLVAILLFIPILGHAQLTGEVEISVTANVGGTTTPPLPPDDEGGGTYISPETQVVFKGRAYPLAHIVILKNGAIMAAFEAEESGLFERTLSGIPLGTYTFGIWAEDTEGRKSVTLSFTAGVISEMTTTISGIFLPPTIALAPAQAEKGKHVDIFGQSFPESQVKIFISSNETIEIIKEANTTNKGKWSYKLDTALLEEREHQVRAMALYGAGEQSLFSQTLSFLVLRSGALACRGADLNFDSYVDIIDFSILLYFWEQKNPSNPCADINGDGAVDIFDFSIMMYWWTK